MNCLEQRKTPGKLFHCWQGGHVPIHCPKLLSLELEIKLKCLEAYVSFNDFSRLAAQDILVSWYKQQRRPEYPLEIAMLAESLAELGETNSLELTAQLRPYFPIDTEAILARYYLRDVAVRSGGEKFLIDKNPLNFMHLGLIAALFPNARVIHCQRNPLDTALSLYFQHFAHQVNAYAYDLEEIAAVTLEYKRLMDHWYSHLPLDIFDLDYQALVKFPEKVTLRLANYLGLEWDEEFLDFHRREGQVETASLWQVRQPLYRTSIDRWKNYEKHLGPLKEQFAKAGII